MEKQYCKVGTVTPITSGRQTLAMIEYQYQTFLEKAKLEYTDAKLVEFFELKAQKLKKVLESL